MRRVVPVVVGVLLAISVLPLLPATPAGAIAGAPTNLTPLNNADVGENPVYISMRHELTVMTSEAVYAELAAYLDDRRAKARKPLPFRVVSNPPPA